MADFPKYTNAQIVIIELDGSEGAYYNTNIGFLPRVGEAIELTSHVDLKSNYPHAHALKVERIKHIVSDLTGDEIGQYLAQIFARRQA